MIVVVGEAWPDAARIEQLTKGTPHQLMLSASTRDALTSAADDLVFVEQIEIRGRTAATDIWSLGGEETTASQEAKSSSQAQAARPGS